MQAMHQQLNLWSEFHEILNFIFFDYDFLVHYRFIFPQATISFVIQCLSHKLIRAINREYSMWNIIYLHAVIHHMQHLNEKGLERTLGNHVRKKKNPLFHRIVFPYGIFCIQG